ncbi:MAG: HelD family protein [Sarcina sp.]
MTIGLKKEDEINYLNKTISAIDEQLKTFGISEVKQSTDIKSDRRHFWSNFSELDEIEIQQFNQNIAMQEKLYLKNQSKIRTLQNQRNTPYFARMDFKEDTDSYAESLYIGISSVIKDDFDFLVLDWRSPISNMFYDFEMGKASYSTPNGEIDGEIILNRQYNIKNGELKFIHESNSNLHDESLLEVLSSNTSDKMKNIVSSIQKKQNEIIRNDKAKVLLLQGCAGSGKTSIAMHRAAYLLYKYRKTLNADNILIFSPNNVFSDYISDVLPGLGEENIRQTTFEQFYKSYLPSIFEYENKHDYLEFAYSKTDELSYKLRSASTKFKNSTEFSTLLEKFCENLDSTLPNFNDVVLGDKVVIKKKEVKDTFVNRFKSIPYLSRIESLKQSLVSKIETMYFKQVKNANGFDFGYNYIDHGDNFNNYLEEAISIIVQDMFKNINPIQIYKKFWIDINDKNLEDIKNFTISSIDDLLVRFEDIVPALYIRCYMEGFKDYNNIKHIIIDECQDYNPLFYKIIKKTFKNASATILGDLNQRIAKDTNIEAKEEISDIFGKEQTQILTLTKSYRSTKSITNFAKEILHTSEAVEAIDRDGLDVQLIKSNDLAFEIETIINQMKNRNIESIAIIPKTAAKAKEIYELLKDNLDINLLIDENSSYSKGLTIIPSYIAKGLEFDGVIIPDCDDSYSDDSERNLLYTVCTRALHELYLLTTTSFSKLINR